MKFLIAIVTLSATLSGTAMAQGQNIVCSGTSGRSGRPFSVEISAGQVIVRGGLLKRPHVFPQITVVNELITAPGLAVSFYDYYGCLRQATIITELQEPFGAGYMEPNTVATCSGGSTPDEICMP